MIRYHLRTAEYLEKCLERLERLRVEKDLPELHRLSNDIQITLPEIIVHENRPLLLDAFRVNHPDDIEGYAPRLRELLERLRKEYLDKAHGG